MPTSSSGTASALHSQWSNPSDVATILMVIGGDVVQKALAQGAGSRFFTPVCFSFGWVSYAFVALVTIIGDGRLLPEPDYPVKVFNLRSGYAHDNKNWVVGRLLRDLETSIAYHEDTAAAREPHVGSDYGIRISVFVAQPNRNGATQFALGWIHLYGLAYILIQLALAAVPIAISGEFDIMIITSVGTLLMQLAGCLPQWRAEKLPNRQCKDATFALTQGNGSREIVVIIGNGNCLDLEELSVSEAPRNMRLWEKFNRGWLGLFASSSPSGSAASRSASKSTLNNYKSAPPQQTYASHGHMALRDTKKHHQQQRQAQSQGQTQSQTYAIRGLPIGFWLTRIVVIAQSVLSLLLLINLASTRSSNWIMIAIGAFGMFQNAYLAGMQRAPEHRNLPLGDAPVEVITAKKVMDGLMDFEVVYGGAESLRDEFFPGRLHEAEKLWWSGQRDVYDDKREAAGWRGLPRSRQQQKGTEGLSGGGKDMTMATGSGV